MTMCQMVCGYGKKKSHVLNKFAGQSRLLGKNRAGSRGVHMPVLVGKGRNEV